MVIGKRVTAIMMLFWMTVTAEAILLVGRGGSLPIVICGPASRRAAIGLVLLATGTCTSATAPCTPGASVITALDEPPSLRAIDISGRCGLREIGLTGSVESITLTPDQTRAYVIAGAGTATGEREIIAIATGRFSVLWRESLRVFGQPQVGPRALTGEGAAISPDGRALYLWRVGKEGTLGVARFDLQSKQATAYSGPWRNLVDLMVLPPSSVFPEGSLVAVGARSGPGPRGEWRVYFFHPASLAVIDSITPGMIGNQRDVWQFVPTSDPQTVYVAGSSMVVRFDLVQRRVTASAQRATSGSLALVPGANVLVLTDAGVWPDSPGSGLLRLYDSNLRFAGAIDVSTPLGQHPNSLTAALTGSAVTAGDGRTLYVQSGSAPRGPLFPIQAARLLAIDVVDKRFLRSIELGGYGLGPILLVTP